MKNKEKTRIIYVNPVDYCILSKTLKSYWSRLSESIMKDTQSVEIIDTEASFFYSSFAKALISLSKTGGWLLCPGCIPTTLNYFTYIPNKITFVKNHSTIQNTIAIIGVPRSSEREINNFLRLCAKNVIRLKFIKNEYYYLHAFDFSAQEYTSQGNVAFFNQTTNNLFYCNSARSLGLPVSRIELPNNTIFTIPLHHICNYDETEYIIYAPFDYLSKLNTQYSFMLNRLFNQKVTSSLPKCRASHLGGHKWRCNMDKASLLFLKKKYEVNSMIDIGCGLGGMIWYATYIGIQAVGIEGDSSLPQHSLIIKHDFTKGVCEIEKYHYDLVWMVEFLEHLDECYLENIIPILLKSKIVFFTFAPKGKDGFHHVNCRSSFYWIRWFKQIGFSIEKASTRYVRLKSSMRRNFVRNTGFVLRNTNYASFFRHKNS